jgi:hypothetical protein
LQGEDSSHRKGRRNQDQAQREGEGSKLEYFDDGEEIKETKKKNRETIGQAIDKSMKQRKAKKQLQGPDSHNSRQLDY